MHPLLSAQAEAALELLPREVFDYFDGGAGDEISRAEAETAWQRWRFAPRALVDVSTVRTDVELLGAALCNPFLVAPMASHALAHPDGEVATVRGANAAGALPIVSTRASRTLEEIGASAGPWWFQVYVTQERAVTAGLIERAAAAGATALVLTGDTPYLGRKKRQGRLEPLTSEAALVNLGRHVPAGADPAAAIEQSRSVTESEIGWLARVSGLPVLVKGILRPDDARRAVDAGAQGIVVSNHGGRQLDRAVASAAALRSVVGAVEVPVLVDGGIRSGADALVALALGARAVLVGRPILWALAAGGAESVAAALAALRDDLEECMGLAGAINLDAVKEDLLVDAGS